MPFFATRSFGHDVVGKGADFFKQACKTRLEDIVSKRANVAYRSGRVGDWLKVKCTKRQEFVVGGWQESEKKGRKLASLVLASKPASLVDCST